VEEVESGKLCQYKSVAILRRERFLRMNGSTLRGRFQRNGTNGRIEIKPFAVSVRGLDSQLDHREVFTLPQWENLIGYMQ